MWVLLLYRVLYEGSVFAGVTCNIIGRVRHGVLHATCLMWGVS